MELPFPDVGEKYYYLQSSQYPTIEQKVRFQGGIYFEKVQLD